MTGDDEIRERIQVICDRDSRYPLQAYLFVQAAVAFTQERLTQENALKRVRHIDGPQLLDGVRELALSEFGPLAKTVLNDWGIHRTRDIGDIVFNLVAARLLGARDSDSIADFEEVFDFEDAFVTPFVPPGAPPTPPRLT